MPDLRTDRLTLRSWRESDVQPWAEMNADPQVREHLGDLLTRAQSAASAARFQAELDERGFGFWAVEVRSTGEFIGFTGLDQVDEDMPFAGVEIGWGLGRAAWGGGSGEAGLRVRVPRPTRNPGGDDRHQPSLPGGDAPDRHDQRPRRGLRRPNRAGGPAAQERAVQDPPVEPAPPVSARFRPAAPRGAQPLGHAAPLGVSPRERPTGGQRSGREGGVFPRRG